MSGITLKPGREKSLLRRHPWIFSGAIESVTAPPEPGATIPVYSHKGQVLALAAWSPASQIRARVWSFAASTRIDADFFQQRLRTAIALRNDLLAQPQGACRLVNAEADGVPGLIVDRYAGFLICQFLSAGSDYWRDAIVAALQALVPCRGIYERSDADIRQKEGLEPLIATLAGEAPPALLEIREADLRYLVDVQHGHKTGFYLDQRDNRLQLAPLCHEAEVLNGFAYSGGFGLRALQAGAHSLVNVDSSEQALALLDQNVELNQLDAGRVTNLHADMFTTLRRFHEEKRKFDVIVLDPPKFVDSKAHLERACRGYKDINRLAMLNLRPGGYLLTFSCSGLLATDLFQKVVADAAVDAGRNGLILRQLQQASDHPVALSFPEGRYLKGLLVKMVD
ncbi:MAG: class I SAM-dependent methyltransferase [Gammaproteobacteria bacterium]